MDLAFHDKSLGEFLLSKSITFPLLIGVLYKLYADISSCPASSASDPVEKTTKFQQGNDDNPMTQFSASSSKDTLVNDAKSVELFGVEVGPDTRFSNWQDIEPIKYRPFKKGEYRLVMGVHNIPAEEWLLVENTYKDFTDLRTKTFNDPELRDHVLFYHPDAEEEIIEFYEMSTQFMIRRYPQFFEVKGDLIHNKIRNEYLPVDPRSVEDKTKLNEYLNSFLEEDFIIMKPTDDEYVFKGGNFTFAAGFDPKIKFNKPMTAIHDPVPEYRTKLQTQMNKFFTKLKPYTYVRRNNWSIQTHNRIFVMNANKGVEDEEIKSLDPDTLDFDREVFFRSERQLLTRLPRTGAIVFTIRTYLTSISQIRKEIKREDLCSAIEDMQWNISQYKRKPEWGEPVVSYLKGESEGCSKPSIVGFANT